MPQSVTGAAKKLPAIIAILVMAFLVTMGEGKCFAEKDKECTFVVRFIGPESVKGDVKLAFSIFGFTKKKELSAEELKRQKWSVGWVSGFQGAPGFLSEITPYTREKVLRARMSDPAEELRTLHVHVNLETLGISRRRFGNERVSGKDLALPSQQCEFVVKYDVKYDEKGYAVPEITSVVETAVTLDKKLKHVEVKESAPIRAAADSPQVKKEEYTVKHSVGFQQGYKVEGEIEVNLSIVELGIKGAIELSTNRTYEQSKTTTREVVIPANWKSYKMVWIETYRTGKAITIIDGKKYEVPFEFREGWDLQTKEVKE